MPHIEYVDRCMQATAAETLRVEVLIRPRRVGETSGRARNSSK